MSFLDRLHGHDDNADSYQWWGSKDYRTYLSSGITWLTWGIGFDLSRDWKHWSATATLGPFWVGLYHQDEL